MAFVETYWGRMGSWRDADVDRFLDAVTPRIMAGRLAVANLTDAYLARTLEREPVGAIDVTTLRNGAPIEEVYRRPAVTLYNELSNGKSFPAALTAATARLVGMVGTDLQLSMQHQARASMGNAKGVEAFRRTLTGRENCALCMIASTQRYWKKDLLPIHPGCDCGVEPLARGQANNQVIDPELLEQTHNWVGAHAGRESDRGARDLGLGKLVEYAEGGERGADYTDLIVVREHGELGPTLTWRHQSFTSADDI